MMKKLLSLIIAVLMVCQLGLPLYAAEEPVVPEVESTIEPADEPVEAEGGGPPAEDTVPAGEVVPAEDAVQVADYAELVAAVEGYNAEAGYTQENPMVIALTADIVPRDTLYIDAGVHIHLTSSGIIRKLANRYQLDYILYVRAGGSLTLSRITIDGGFDYDFEADKLPLMNEGHVVITNGATLTGGLWEGVVNKGTLLMNGGTVAGNRGAGIYNYGVFRMSGGVIFDNSRETDYGNTDLYIGEDSTVHLSGTIQIGTENVGGIVSEYGVLDIGDWDAENSLVRLKEVDGREGDVVARRATEDPALPDFTAEDLAVFRCGKKIGLEIRDGKTIVLTIPELEVGSYDWLAYLIEYFDTEAGYTEENPMEVVLPADIQAEDAKYGFILKEGVHIRLTSEGTAKKIVAGRRLDEEEYSGMFNVEPGASLALAQITIDGDARSESALIDNHGALLIEEGTTLTGSRGCAVYNVPGAILTMTGGTITGNRSWGYCGGVENAGVFNMSGGSIYGNIGNADSYYGRHASDVWNEGESGEDAAVLNLSGSPVIGNGYLTGLGLGTRSEVRVGDWDTENSRVYIYHSELDTAGTVVARRAEADPALPDFTEADLSVFSSFDEMPLALLDGRTIGLAADVSKPVTLEQLISAATGGSMADPVVVDIPATMRAQGYYIEEPLLLSEGNEPRYVHLRAPADDPLVITRNVYDEYDEDDNTNLITIPDGSMLILENVIVNDHGSEYYYDFSGAALRVQSGGRLELREGSGVQQTANYAINIESGGEAVMNGGTLSASNSNYDVGVYNRGTFKMNDGAIEWNSSNMGGGVVNEEGATFTMTGGAITGGRTGSGSGGVTNGGTFIMSGGSITGNHASWYGGGVCNYIGATFIMTGGEISGNTAGVSGADVYVVEESSNITLSGAPVIGGKTAGGIYLAGVDVLVRGGLDSGASVRIEGAVNAEDGTEVARKVDDGGAAADFTQAEAAMIHGGGRGYSIVTKPGDASRLVLQVAIAQVGTAQEMNDALDAMDFSGIIEVTADITLDRYIGIDPGGHLTIRSADGTRYVLTAGPGMQASLSMIGVARTSSLVLENIELDGNAQNLPQRTNVVLLNYGTARLDNVVVRGGASSYGGGVYNTGTLEMKNSTITGNTAHVLGGGLYNFGEAAITASTITENSAPFAGDVYSNEAVTVSGKVVIGGEEASDSGFVYDGWDDYGVVISGSAPLTAGSKIFFENTYTLYPGVLVASVEEDSGLSNSNYAQYFSAGSGFRVVGDEVGIRLQGTAPAGSLQARIYSGEAEITLTGQEALDAPLYIAGSDGGGAEVTIKGGTLARGGWNGNLVHVARESSLTLKDITLDGGSRESGGTLVYNEGELRLESGATLQNNINTHPYGSQGPAGGGAVVNVLSGVVVAFDGATITGNSARPASDWSGTLYGHMGGGILNNGLMNLNGGTIAGNTATPYLAGGISGGEVYNSGSLNIDGRVTIGEEDGAFGLYTPTYKKEMGYDWENDDYYWTYSGKFYILSLPEGSHVNLEVNLGVQHNIPFATWDNAEAAMADEVGRFTVLREGYRVGESEPDYTETRYFTLREDALPDGVDSFAELLWSLESGGVVELPAGHYYIHETVYINEDFGVRNLTLRGTGAILHATPDLKEHMFEVERSYGLTLENMTLDGEGGIRKALVRNRGTLNIGDGARLVNNTSTDFGGAIENTAKLTINGEGAEISGNSAKRGGGVASYADWWEPSIVTFTKGAITGNTSAVGSGVYVRNSDFDYGASDGDDLNYARFTMNGAGATITNNDDGGAGTSYGGGLYIAQGTAAEGGAKASLIEGVISGNTIGGFGGGVYNRDGTVEVGAGFAIDDNTASLGGGVATLGGGLQLDGAITGNLAYSLGGGVYGEATSDAANHVTVGGMVSGNRAATGGGIYMEDLIDENDEASRLALSGGEVSGNAASYQGGGIALVGVEGLLESDAAVTDNTSAVVGGGIYNQGGEFVLSGGTLVSGNEAPSGGGIYNLGSLRVNGATVAGNVGTTGVEVYTEKDLFLLGGAVIGAKGSFGGLYLGAFGDTDATADLELGLEAGASIVVENTEPGRVVAVNATQGDAAYFECSGGVAPNYDAGEGVLTVPSDLKYTVTYRGNGATSTVTDINSYESGESVTVLGAPSTAPAGTVFQGWNELATGDGKTYQPGDTFTITGNVTLYAIWRPTSYAITYTGLVQGVDEALQNPNPTTYVFGAESITLAAPLVLRTGYAFGGWTYDEAGTQPALVLAAADVAQHAENGVLALYAQWTPRGAGYVPVESVRVAENLRFVSGGASQKLDAVLSGGGIGVGEEMAMPAAAPTVRDLLWQSGDEAVATVDAAGNITPVGAGQAVVSAIAVDGGKRADCRVVVTEGAPTEQVTLDLGNVVLAVGDDAQLTFTASVPGILPAVSYTDKNHNPIGEAAAVAVATATGTDLPGGADSRVIYTVKAGNTPGVGYIRFAWAQSESVYAECKVEVVPALANENTPPDQIAAFHLNPTTLAVNTRVYEDLRLNLWRDKGDGAGAVLNLAGRALEFSPAQKNPTEAQAANIATLNRLFTLTGIDENTVRLKVNGDLEDDDLTALYKLKATQTVKLGIKLSDAVTLPVPETLTLKLSHKVPAVKAASVKIDAFFGEPSAAIVPTTATGEVQALELNDGKQTANEKLYKGAKAFLKDPTNEFEDGGMTLRPITDADGRAATGSGTLSLRARLRDWGNDSAWSSPFSVKVSSTRVNPPVKLSASSVSIFANSAASQGVKLSVVPKKAGVDLSDYVLTDVRLAEASTKYPHQDKYQPIDDFDPEDGSFTLKMTGTPPSGKKVLLDLEFGDDEVQVYQLPVTVKVVSAKTRVSLKASKKSITLNANLQTADSYTVNITPSVKDFDMTDYYPLKAGVKGFDADTAPLRVEANGPDVKITVLKDRIEALNGYGKTYRVEIEADEINKHVGKGDEDASITLSVKIASKTAKVKATMSVKGRPDLTTGAGATVNFKFTNYLGGYARDGVTFRVLDKNGNTVTGQFRYDCLSPTSYSVVPVGNELAPGKYRVYADATVLQTGETNVLPSTKGVSMTVKATVPKLTASTKNFTLYLNDAESEGVFTITRPEGCPEIVKNGVKIKGGNEGKDYGLDVVDMGGGKYAFRFNPGNMPTKGKTRNLTLNVTFEGNTAPAATLKMKVVVKGF